MSGSKKRKINIKHLMIMIMIGIIIFIGFLAVATFTVRMLTVEEVIPYNKDTKSIGTIEHYTEETDQYFLSFYYPVYHISALDQIVSTYQSQNLMTDMVYKNPFRIEVDYDTKEVLDYIQLTFHQVIKDQDDNIIKTVDVSYNYDKKTKKVLTYKDVLRRNYFSLLKQFAINHKMDPSLITKENLQNFLIEKDHVIFYFHNSIHSAIKLNYAENAAYIKLNRADIPSLYHGEVLQGAATNVDPTKPMIAITFDDGPHTTNTQSIMAEFDKYNGKATFFLLGRNVKSGQVDRSAIVKDMAQRGFELGNHSWDHSMAIAAMKQNYMNTDEVTKEIYDTQDAIYSATGIDPSYFRPPYGALNDNVRSVSSLDFALWDIDTNDWKNKNPDSLAQLADQQAYDGAVVLIHDIHDTSTAAITKLLPKLKDKGYQFVTLSTLMKYKGAELVKKNIIIPATLQQ